MRFYRGNNFLDFIFNTKLIKRNEISQKIKNPLSKKNISDKGLKKVI